MKTQAQLTKKSKTAKRQTNNRLILFLAVAGATTLVAAVLAAWPLVSYIGARLFA